MAHRDRVLRFDGLCRRLSGSRRQVKRSLTGGLAVGARGEVTADTAVYLAGRCSHHASKCPSRITDDPVRGE
jgi:hypothetical protein